MRHGLKAALVALALGSAVPAVHAQDSAKTAQPAQIDPARLAAATPVVAKLFPVGTYKRMMGETMSKMMDGMMGSMLRMPVAQIAKMSGLSTEKVLALPEASVEEVTTIVDPHFRKRTKLGMDAMFGSMADLMDSFEPNVRAALTRAYARKFEIAQLGEINAFFDTPTGNKFASDYMSMFVDPEIMGEMQALMPEMMKKMPDFVTAAEKATKGLPPARKIQDLSKAEREKLAQLLGVKASELK